MGRTFFSARSQCLLHRPVGRIGPRRLQSSLQTPDIPIPEVIGEDEHHVWPTSLRRSDPTRHPKAPAHQSAQDSRRVHGSGISTPAGPTLAIRQSRGPADAGFGSTAERPGSGDCKHSRSRGRSFNGIIPSDSREIPRIPLMPRPQIFIPLSRGGAAR